MNTQQVSRNVRRYGLLKMRVGANFVIKGKDRVGRQFEVQEKAKAPKGAKLVVICLQCKETFANEEECIGMHPTKAIMERTQETHVYGWWCGDKKDPKDDAHDSEARVHGLYSDEG